MPAKEDNKKILIALFSVMCKLREQTRVLAGRPKISLTHMQALGYIFQKKNTTMNELAHYLGITPPSTTVLTNTLITKRYIERVNDPNDRRAIRLRVTTSGHKMLAERTEVVLTTLKGTFAKLSSVERRKLVELLQKIN